MTLSYKKHSLSERDEYFLFLAKMIKDEKKKGVFKVLNVGGGLDRLGVKMDAVFDLRGDQLSKEKADHVYARDICHKDSWVDIEDNSFDFVICTHTLEDIRDPIFAIEQMQRVAKAGFFAVPSIERELSFSRSPYYVGYAHHRWVFEVMNDKLIIAPKFSSVDYLVNLNIFPWRKKPKHSINIFLKNIARYFIFRYNKILNGKISYFEYSEKDVENFELAIWWSDNINFEVLNGDLFLPPYDDCMVRVYTEAFGRKKV